MVIVRSAGKVGVNKYRNPNVEIRNKFERRRIVSDFDMISTKQWLTRQIVCELGLVDDQLPVDQDVFDSNRILVGLFESGLIDDGLGVEDGDVGIVAFTDEAAVFQTEGEGGLAGHFSDGFFQGNDVLFTDVFA